MRFTKDHEWVEVVGGVATVGITAYAAEQLGDVVYVEVPEAGRTVKAGEGLAVVESVKAASDVYAPVSGQVVEANTALSQKDYSGAFSKFSVLAQHGNATAQFNLGAFYLNGQGVQRDAGIRTGRSHLLAE